MSVAYLRSDALTQLASCGTKAFDEIQKATSDLLGEAPGSWMPSDVAAPLELVERAYQGTNHEGKRTLGLAVLEILNNLGLAWLRRNLSPAESRQLLGAMELGTVWQKDTELLCSKVARVVVLAKLNPKLFAARVVQAPEIVGPKKGDLDRFVQSLDTRLPGSDSDSHKVEALVPIAASKKLRKRLDSFRKWANQEEVTSHSELDFLYSRAEGRPGIIQLATSGRVRFVGVCPLQGGEDAIDVAEDLDELRTFFGLLGKKTEADNAPVLNVGFVQVRDQNSLNLIEGAYSRARSRVFGLIVNMTAARISSSRPPEEVANILWHESTAPQKTSTRWRWSMNFGRERRAIHEGVKLTQAASLAFAPPSIVSESRAPKGLHT